MTNFLFILAFLLAVAATSYLLHKYHIYIQYQTRKKSLPLPPIDSFNSNFNSQIVDIKKNKVLSKDLAAINWLELISDMRKQGQTESALSVCESKFPLYSAYRQATLILRSILQDKNIDEKKTHETLLRLYKTAATAEMIHMKKSTGETISSTTLKKINMPLIENFSFEYNNLGYTEIPLLTKKDIKALVSRWGEPKKHESPRSLYQKYLN
mgnify:CR=1 FL=1